jgi:hypothetical protein
MRLLEVDDSLQDVAQRMSLTLLLPIGHFCDFERKMWRMMLMSVEVVS